jgi:hypothetical protein
MDAEETDPEAQVEYFGSRGAIVNSLKENGRRIVLKPRSLMRQATVAKSATIGFWTLPHRPSTTERREMKKKKRGGEGGGRQREGGSGRGG